MSNSKKPPRDAAWIEQTMRDVERSIGSEAADSLKKLGNPKDLEKMLGSLSESDMARLEGLLQDPKRLQRLLNGRNMAKIKKILEE